MAEVPSAAALSTDTAPSFFEKYKIPLLVGGGVLVFMLLKHKKDAAATSAGAANMVVPNMLPNTPTTNSVDTTFTPSEQRLNETLDFIRNGAGVPTDDYESAQHEVEQDAWGPLLDKSCLTEKQRLEHEKNEQMQSAMAFLPEVTAAGMASTVGADQLAAPQDSEDAATSAMLAANFETFNIANAGDDQHDAKEFGESMSVALKAMSPAELVSQESFACKKPYPIHVDEFLRPQEDKVTFNPSTQFMFNDSEAHAEARAGYS